MNVIEEIKQIGMNTDSYENCIQMIIDKKNGLTDVDWAEICNIYNLPISPDTLRKANGSVFGGAAIAEYFKNKNNSFNQNDGNLVGSELKMNKDGTYSSSKLIKMDEDRLKEPKYVLNMHGFDDDCWKIVSSRHSIREVSRNKGEKETLYSSYITVKPLESSELSLSKISDFFDRLDRNYSIPTIKKSKNYLDGDKLLLIDIADLHMNLQSSLFTSGNDYNCDIAEQLFFYVISDILSRTSSYQFKEIVFIIGGDMMNADNLFGTTTRGTQQDNDVSYYDAYERLCAMTIKAIDILKERSKVSVIYIMGNHDEMTGFKLAKYIDAWFRNDDMVNVDYSPIARKYKKFGKTLLAFAHDGNVQKLPAIISNEAREYWSEVDMTEVFLQHFHHEQILVEENNIRIQRLPTISANSKWSSNKGYFSKRQCKSFIFDINDGMTDILYTPIKTGR